MVLDKYSSRALSSVSRDTHSQETTNKEPSWFNDFVSNLEKSSTKSKSQDYSIMEQINNILSNKSKYSNVEEAVLDMQKRTGLFDYMQSKIAQIDTNVASTLPAIFTNVPAMKTFIDNYTNDRPGSSVESVVHDLLRVKTIKELLPNRDDVSEDVRHYINNKLKEHDANRPQSDTENLQLGKLDMHTDDNTARDNNPFGGCEPNNDAAR